MKRKSWIYLILAILILGSIVSWQYWRVRDTLYEWHYVYTHTEAKVETQQQLHTILSKFEKVSYSNLPESYLKKTHSDQTVFKKMLRSKTYYQISGKDVYMKIVGNYRIKDFLPKDQFYKKHVLNIKRSKGIYWLIDKKLLYKFLELQQILRAKGYQDDGFIVVNGYRPPAYNIAKGGASRSRHIKGEAVDILIKDIDGNGRITQQDKSIVLDILDKTVIGNSGGLGKYPGTMSVHFDVRGRRARWDRQ